MKYRPDIDGLRTVAVMPVVLYHAGLPGLSGGFLGVDVFFVISGFLITSILAAEIGQGRYSLLRFYERRARRILPALLAVVGASLAVGWFGLLPFQFADLGESALATAGFASNVYFMLKLDYFGPAAEFSPLLHTWSLAVEEQFYILFPPLLALGLMRWGLRRTLWALGAACALSLLAAALLLPSAPKAVFYLLPFRAWELGLGALLALAALPPPRRRALREALAALGLLAIVAPMALYDSTTPFPGLAAVPPVLGTVLLIHLGSGGAPTLVQRLLASAPMVAIGLVSYSLYLWHWPVMAYARIGIDDVHLPPALAAGTVVLSLALAWLSWRVIERPFRRPAAPPEGALPGPAGGAAPPPAPGGLGRRAIFALSGAGLAATAAAGALIVLRDGLPERIPPEAGAVLAARAWPTPFHLACFGRLPEEELCAIGAGATDGADGPVEGPVEGPVDGPIDGPVDFLLWGDSHAASIVTAVDKAARAAGLSGLYVAGSGCPPVRDVGRVPARQPCERLVDAVRRFLAARDDLPVVILAARWTRSVEGTRYRAEAGLPVRLAWRGPPEAAPAEAGNAALLEAGLVAELDALRAQGRTTILLGPLPEAGFDVPTQLARDALWGREGRIHLTRAAFDARAGRTMALLARIAEGRSDMAYHPLSQGLCDAAACAVADAAGLPNYRDDDHITNAAADRLLTGYLAEALAAAVRPAAAQAATLDRSE
jgi:peptidoglycan/LPS O-acetylase OafA/YrhL